ncbi:uncharacterized protein LOC121376537 [Gigantopelta aegis]|uniref:uncharacterized protein LOC121376537 n=1 Tax=Gigantopelta aegis TaxID=1735272 RepID=UPI001B88E5D6|nr:uncharacterized protein LOC121376537 [Gigantopelta aegis]
MLFHLLTIILAVILVPVGCYSKTKDEEMSMETNFIVPYDVPFNLSCQNYVNKFDGSLLSNTRHMMWILPNGDFIKHGQSTQHHKRVHVFHQGRQLKIRKLNDEDFGTYTCLIYTPMTKQYTIIQKTVNINGPYWGDLTEKYRVNLIIGSVAASVVLLFMLAFCWCYHRNSYDSDNRDCVLSTFSPTAHCGHDNVTYDVDCQVKNTLPDSSPALEVQEVKVEIQHAIDTKL